MRLGGITFDFGGTLDADGEHWCDRFARLYGEVGCRVDSAQLRAAFDEATRAGYAASGLRHASLSELVDFHLRAQWKALGWKWSDSAQAIVVLFLQETQAYLQRNRALLERLRGRVRLGVISNFYGNLPRVLEEAGMACLFDSVLDSTIEGFRKPAPEIFALAAARLQLAPRELLHIGDSLEQDVFAAKRAGFQAAWLCGNQDDTGCQRREADWVLHSLEELIPLVERAAVLDSPRGSAAFPVLGRR